MLNDCVQTTGQPLDGQLEALVPLGDGEVSPPPADVPERGAQTRCQSFQTGS